LGNRVNIHVNSRAVNIPTSPTLATASITFAPIELILSVVADVCTVDNLAPPCWCAFGAPTTRTVALIGKIDRLLPFS
jgi:hypothetical protein